MAKRYRGSCRGGGLSQMPQLTSRWKVVKNTTHMNNGHCVFSFSSFSSRGYLFVQCYCDMCNSCKLVAL